jgi:hypothetical protein
MALPTSTIVMAVLTCVPFGLAIRDTVNGPPAVVRGDDSDYGDMDDEEEVDYAAENARREAEEAAEAAEEQLEEAKKEQRRVSRRSLFGAEVATLGSGFSGISLGMAESEIRLTTIRTLETETAVDVELLSNGTLDWILVKAEEDSSEDDSEELCSGLGQDLKDAWGAGQTEDYDSRVWVNPTTGTRASLANVDGCRLSFERFAASKDWVTKAQTSVVPLWLVGQPIKKLREHLGTRSELDESEPSVRWLGLGVGFGSGEARFEAHYVKGKVVAVVATTNTFDATRDEVAAQLTSLYGAPVQDDDGNLLWKKSKPVIQLDDYEGAGIRLTAGKVPDSE